MSVGLSGTPPVCSWAVGVSAAPGLGETNVFLIFLDLVIKILFQKGIHFSASEARRRKLGSKAEGTDLLGFWTIVPRFPLDLEA